MKTRRKQPLYGCVIIIGLWLTLSASAANLRPIELLPSFDHDKYAPTPNGDDIVGEFRAYTTCFDGADDDNGDGTPDLWGIPHWVAYEMHKAPDGLGTAPDRPSKWITDPSELRPTMTHTLAPATVGGICA